MAATFEIPAEYANHFLGRHALVPAPGMAGPLELLPFTIAAVRHDPERGLVLIEPAAPSNAIELAFRPEYPITIVHRTQLEGVA